MSSQPWYPWFPGDFAIATSHLSYMEDAAYRRLLDHYYSTGRALPNDPDRLSRIARAQKVTEIAAVKTVIAEFFTVAADGLLHNKRADSQIKRQRDFTEAQSKKGKLSAKARWGGKDAAEVTAVITGVVTGPITEQVTDDITESQPDGLPDGNLHIHIQNLEPESNSKPREIERRDRSGKGAKKHAMPATFAVSDRVRLWAEGKGWSNLEGHLESFRLKCQANGYIYADWDSALMEAIRKDWAGLRVNGRDGSGETLAQLLAREPLP